MSELTTCCPSCKVTFQVTPAQLKAAAGKVRCGLCQQVFNAHENSIAAKEEQVEALLDDDLLIYDDMPLPGDPLPETTDVEKEDSATPHSAIPENNQSTSKAEQQSPVQHEEEPLPIPDFSSFEPEEPEAEAVSKKPKPWLFSLLLLASCCLLAVQYIHFHANTLAENPAYRALVSSLCNITGCNIPAQNLAKISTANLVVQTHPSSPEALKVSLILTNQASYEQPFPNLVLMFEDLNGNTLAARQFSANQYLQGEMAKQAAMPIGQPIYIELEIVDPGDTAQSYSLLLN